MAIASFKKSLRTGVFILGVGLLLLFMYSKIMENAKSSTKRDVQTHSSILQQLYQISNRENDFGDILANGNQEEKISKGDCRWVEPWINRTHWKYTHLVFYGKPIMQALKTISIERHWKMTLILNDTTAGLMHLHDLISSKDTFTIIVTSSRFYKHFTTQAAANNTTSLVSAIRYAFKIAGGKKGQLSSFRKHFTDHGCKLEQRQLMPRSFMLDDSRDCVQFFKYANSKPDSWWVLKQSQGYGGSGISIHRNLSRLYKDFGVCSSNKEYVVQEYLSNLLLIEKRKFDIRGLVLIASTNPYMLFHHDGYLRLSVKEYSSTGGRAVHITNSHLQVKAKEYSADKHLWSFRRFQAYLDEHYPDNEDFVSKKLIPFIKKTAVFILQAGRNIFTPYPSSYQLLGLDFMVTSDFRVWFIEANNYPLWPKGSSFVDDLTETMGRRIPTHFTSMHPGDWYKSWQLVWNELDEKCSHNLPYNPCDQYKIV